MVPIDVKKRQDSEFGNLNQHSPLSRRQSPDFFDQFDLLAP